MKVVCLFNSYRNENTNLVIGEVYDVIGTTSDYIPLYDIKINGKYIGMYPKFLFEYLTDSEYREHVINQILE